MFEILKNFKKHLMSGVSYMIPVVTVGGIVMGLGIVLGGNVGVPKEGSFALFIFVIGKTGLSLLAPFLAGYIAYSIADKVALAPAFICGVIATNGGSGFLGGVISGLVVGIICHYLKKVKISRNFIAFYNMIFIPIVSTLIVAVIIQYGIGIPIASFLTWLKDTLAGMDTKNLLLVGLIIGAVGSADLGLFGTKMIGLTITSMLLTMDPKTGLPILIARQLLAACIVTSTVPPLVCGIASLIGKKKFNSEEREAGKAALVLSAFGITEGAIPFALNDIKAIPCCMIGAITAAELTLYFGAATTIGWGGIVTLPGMQKGAMYILSAIIGGIVGGVLMAFFKKQSVEVKTEYKEMKVVEHNNEVDLDF